MVIQMMLKLNLYIDLLFLMEIEKMINIFYKKKPIYPFNNIINKSKILEKIKN